MIEPEGKNKFDAKDMLTKDELRYFELLTSQEEDGHPYTYLRRLSLPMGINRAVAVTSFTVAVLSFVGETSGQCYPANTGFLLSTEPDTVKSPDFAYIKQERLLFPRGEGFVPVVPDLVVESEGSTLVRVKIAEWLGFGAKYALDLNVEQKCLTVYRQHYKPVVLGRNETFDAKDLLPGFELPLEKVFI